MSGKKFLRKWLRPAWQKIEPFVTRWDKREHLSNRFAKAVELTSNDNLSIRLGGLHLFKSLAKESPDEHKRVFTYLCHFLRHPPDLEDWTSDLEKGEAQCSSDQSKISFGQRPDIGEICKMICERKMEQGPKHMVLNLNRACLRGANLVRADLQEANLEKANLREAMLWSSHLQKAELGAADLQDADITVSNLQGAILLNAKLQEADLQGAILQGAILLSAELQGADFSNALFGNLDSDRGQDLTAFRNLEQLKDTYYDEASPDPALHESLPQELGDKTSPMRETYLQLISREEWVEKYSPKTRP